IVLALYEPSGGKNVRHGSVDSSTNICALSYLALQTYEPALGNLFRAVRPKFQMAYSFAHVPPTMFLCSLADIPASTNGHLRLSRRDQDTYQTILSNMSDVRAALKRLGSRKD
ncbi:hypothetical protein GGU11DRAFT_693235, partial [Lentinula aff. detonsa]